jgi:hypothetical protein
MTFAVDRINVNGKVLVIAKDPALRDFCMTFNIVGVTGYSSVWPSQQLVASCQQPATRNSKTNILFFTDPHHTAI